jgi:hypothetical protein
MDDIRTKQLNQRSTQRNAVTQIIGTGAIAAIWNTIVDRRTVARCRTTVAQGTCAEHQTPPTIEGMVVGSMISLLDVRIVLSHCTNALAF